MDDSARKKSEVSYVPVMVRALFSAAIFGTIGGYFGKWLGVRGNAPASDMARPMMQWGMAGFWAFLAAYCSLKASEREAREDGVRRMPMGAVHGDSAFAMADTPRVSVEAAGAVREGEVAAVNAEKQRG